MRRAIAVCCVLFIATPLLAGDLTARFELTLNRVLGGGPPQYTQDFLLADAIPKHERRFTEFSGDLSGRYVEALSEVAAYTGRRMPELDQLVSKLLPLQKPDGHFGDPFGDDHVSNTDMAQLWGNGRLLVGLLAYQRVAPSPQVLATCQRLGDFLVAVAPRLNDDAVQREFSDGRVAVGYICWTQTIEGLVELSRTSRDDKYRNLAADIAARTVRYPSQHSHGFVTSLRGILDLHRATGDARYLAQVETEWQGIIDSGNLLVQGALPEAFAPSIKRDEGCSEADWLRLNLALWNLTGKPQYVEHAERTLFNEFAFNQFRTGDFGHHVITPAGMGPPGARAWWCCTLHGLRAFPEVLRSAFRTENLTTTLALPIDGFFASGAWRLRSESRLAQDATVAVEVLGVDRAQRTIAIRVPAWAKAVAVSVNGADAGGEVKDGLLHIARPWSVGDRVVVQYDLATRVEKQPDGRIAYLRGPWLLGVSDSRSPFWFDEPHAQNRVTTTTVADDLELAGPSTLDGRFAIAVAHRQIRFLPGGYPTQPQTAVLRPIAEQTDSDANASWDFLFAPQGWSPPPAPKAK
jgi:DUF1680 family protein